MNYVNPFAACCFLSSPFSVSLVFRLFCTITVICLGKQYRKQQCYNVRGHCTVIEQSLLDTTLGRSPPKAFEQIICTGVSVNYLEFRPCLFQMVSYPKSLLRERGKQNYL